MTAIDKDEGRLRSLTRLEVMAAARAKGMTQRDGRDASEPASEGFDSEACAPAAIHFCYADATAEETERTVVLFRIWPADDFVRFSGYCALRGCRREFRSDRVRALVCLTTGEAPDDPTAWLRAHALFIDDPSADNTRRALASTRDELIVLAALARADGVFDADEVEAIVDLVHAAAPRGPFNRERAAGRVRRIAPDPDSIDAAVARICARPERFARFKHAARRTLDADGAFDWQEQEAMARIMAAAERAAEARLARQAEE